MSGEAAACCCGSASIDKLDCNLAPPMVVDALVCTEF